ncbi:TPA: PIN domain-containing protein [Acinetobacter baumannii]|uniref:PIN domain-containing protein n=1 Tax=Acinetobacter baumannii TaxID=470 RepID=UPI00056F688F|nr:PIN domain-containing protein [Acinetobacter baumannii]ELA6826178.1 PIN domain-containing protein [Acinetobacter baumannii]ELA6833893.1 PIN domain-containing protein [Acinetobacter baumannii]ELA6842128.1 PIN domain-containing protein [Acinetobacter baumannii]ELA6862293.1 PIN domain-containing protein [Acinetobacter baumannii]MBD0448302.1 PIN domain-containing protein [Acinetobacter baumannii]
MIIAIDANILIALFDDNQFAFAFKQFCKQHQVAKVILPMPAMCEFISHDNINRFQFVKSKSKTVVLVDFDEKSAITTARLAEKYYANRLDIDKQKVKVDLQILGTAISNRAQFILTKDTDFVKYLERLKPNIGLKTIKDLMIEADLFS